jgi:hypothetical protein
MHSFINHHFFCFLFSFYNFFYFKEMMRAPPVAFPFSPQVPTWPPEGYPATLKKAR